MKTSLSIIGLVAASLLSGCAVDEPMEKKNGVIALTTKVGENSVSLASGVRWNDDYIVTVKHLDDLAANRCESSTLDLAFYKSPKKKEDSSEQWGNMKSGTEVTMLGYSNGSELVSLKGKVIVGVFTYADEPKYKLASNMVSKGMSGGPVKDDSGKTVGLIVGYTAEPVKLVSEGKLGLRGNQYSVLVPYSTIVDGWEEVQSQIKQGKC